MTEPTSNNSTQRTHDLATLAVSLAFVGVALAMTGPWLVVPSLLCAYFANKAILREPEKFKGRFFVNTALLLNLVTLLIFALFFYSQK